jgi:DNA repair protein RecO (recombination protein O)
VELYSFESLDEIEKIDNDLMRTQAIIVRKINTNEYDQVVVCYTKEFGKMAAVAKSIMKPKSIQAMHLDLFNLVNFDLVDGRAFPIITGAQLETSHMNIKSSLPHLAVAYFFAEVMNKIVYDNDKDDELWEFSNHFLSELNSIAKQDNDPSNFFRHSQARLLEILGYSADLSRGHILGNIFESVANTRLHSLRFINTIHRNGK